jgi:hypothetical protein
MISILLTLHPTGVAIGSKEPSRIRAFTLIQTQSGNRYSKVGPDNLTNLTLREVTIVTAA